MITREKFEAYEVVRRSGVTNMFAVNVVSSLSGLTREEVIEIIKNYGRYREKFGR